MYERHHLIENLRGVHYMHVCTGDIRGVVRRQSYTCTYTPKRGSSEIQRIRKSLQRHLCQFLTPFPAIEFQLGVTF